MTKKQELIDYVIGNEFITKPSLQEKFTDLLDEALTEQLVLYGVINWVAISKEEPPVDKEVLFYENGEIYTSEMDKWKDIIYIEEPVFPTHWAEKPKPPCI